MYIEQSRILQEVIQKRNAERETARKKKAEEEDATEAKTHVPELKERLGSLIQTHITQEQQTVSVEENLRIAFSYDPDKSTVLEALISHPDEDKQIKVTITSFGYLNSGYPGNSEEAKINDYTVNIEELDSYLQLRAGVGTIVPKSMRDSKQLVKAKYEPLFTLPISMVDVANYSGLLNVLESGKNVKFSGTTPVKRNIDPGNIPDNWKNASPKR